MREEERRREQEGNENRALDFSLFTSNMSHVELSNYKWVHSIVWIPITVPGYSKHIQLTPSPFTCCNIVSLPWIFTWYCCIYHLFHLTLKNYHEIDIILIICLNYMHIYDTKALCIIHIFINIYFHLWYLCDI